MEHIKKYTKVRAAIKRSIYTSTLVTIVTLSYSRNDLASGLSPRSMENESFVQSLSLLPLWGSSPLLWQGPKALAGAARVSRFRRRAIGPIQPFPRLIFTPTTARAFDARADLVDFILRSRRKYNSVYMCVCVRSRVRRSGLPGLCQRTEKWKCSRGIDSRRTIYMFLYETKRIFIHLH